MITTTLALLALSQGPPPAPSTAPTDTAAPAEEARRTGVLTTSDGLAPGYTLFAPLNAGSTWLVDANGEAVHSWHRESPPGQSVCLLPSGHLLRAERPETESPMGGGGEGGRLVELDWDGEVVWTYELHDDARRLHHDFEPLPNGNVLAIVWIAKTYREAGLLGRDLESLDEERGLWPDAILELRPTRPAGAEIVWEWHAFDHLVQDQRDDLPGFGVVAEHPRRINVNIGTDKAKRPETDEERAERMATEAKLRALGYSGGGGGGGDRGRADWMHSNAIDHDPELDLIALSLRAFSEVWIIDHSTTTDEARGSTGGRQGVGGDLVWRYGNPENHHAGGAAAQVSFGQHDVRWTRHEGAPALTIFNNGDRRPDGKYSSVDLVTLPVGDAGRVAAPVGGRFAPAGPAVSWTADPPESIFSSHISGAQHLAHGGFLVCDGEGGRILEVSRDGDVLWEFVNPVEGALGRGPRGARGGPGSPNALFRAERIAPDHPGLTGRELTPRALPKGMPGRLEGAHR